MRTVSKGCFLLILLFLQVNTNLTAQNKYDVDQFFTEGREFLTQPAEWNGRDFLRLSIILGGTYGLMHVDEDVRTFSQDLTAFRNSAPVLFGRFYGEPLTPVILGSFFIIHGNSTGNPANKKLGFEIVQSFFYALGLTKTLKYVFGRERPFTAKTAFEFYPLSLRSNDYLALPSGHTTIAFALSTVISENSKSDFWKTAVYVPAVITALSRVYENRHWASDVFLGAAIGYFSAKFFTQRHSAKELEHAPLSDNIFSVTIPIN